VSRIPPWGLYRLLKAVRAKGINQRLDLVLPGGRISLGILSGHPYYVLSDMLHFSFGAFLANARLIPDDAVASIEAASRNRQGPPCLSFLDAAAGTPEQARKFAESHVRSVLTAIMPVPVSEWSLSDEEPCARECGCQGIDPAPELMRAIAAYPRPEEMRPTVQRFLAGGPFLLARGGEAHLTFAKAHIADSKVLYLVRQGRAREINDEILKDDNNIRILFGLTVAEALTRDTLSGAAPRGVVNGNDVVVRELRDAIKDIQSKNHYELLQVPIDARPSEVDEAWAVAARRYSRSAYEDIPESEVAEHLDTIHARLDKARAVLCDRKRRNAYNRSLDAVSPDLEARLARMFDARDVWSAGKALMRRNKPAEALIRFEEALRQDPDDPIYKVSLAQALVATASGPDDLDRGRSILENVLKDHDKMVDAHIGMAQYHRLTGNISKAQEHVRKAMQLEPGNDEAKRLKEILSARAKPSRMVFNRKSESVIEKLKSRFSLRKKSS